jgi:hypothetical protein
MRCLPISVIVVVLFASGWAHAQASPSSSRLSVVTQAALRTQQQCQMLLHHDAEDFVDCVDDLIKPHRKPTLERLGVEYFGWVGALNSARMSFPGANDAADRYLRRFRKTQRQLRITDDALCTTIPGDCLSRNARMLQMEALPPVKASHFGGQGAAGHRH